MARQRKETTEVNNQTENIEVNNTKHVKEKTFLCKWCKKTFLSAEALLKHSIICEQNND